MSIWAFDGWPLARFVAGLPGVADLLRTFPGAGPDVAYGPGQTFYNDLTKTTVDYDTAIREADAVTAWLLKLQAPQPGIYAGWPIDESLHDIAQRKGEQRPDVVGAPRQDVGPVPQVGTIILAPIPGQTMPPAPQRTPGGGIYLVPTATPAVAGQPTPSLPGGIYVVPLPPVTPAPAPQRTLPGGIYLVPITTPIPSPQVPPVRPPGITIVPIGQPAPSPQPAPQPGPRGDPGPQGPQGPQGPPGVIPQQLIDLINGIDDAVSDIETGLNGISGGLQSKLDGLASRIEGRLSKVVDDVVVQLSAATADITHAVSTAESHITAQLTAAVADIERTVNQSAASITQQIGGQISTLEGDIGTAFESAGHTIASSVDAVADAITAAAIDPGDVLGAVFAFGQHTWPSWIEPLRQLVAEPLKFLLHSLEQESSEGIDALLSSVLNVPELPPEVRDLFEQAKAKEHPFWFGVLAAVAVSVMTPFAKETLGPAIETFRQRIAAQTQTGLASSSELVAARILGVIDEATYFRLSELNGDPDGVSNIRYRAAEQVPAPDTLADLWRRGVIDDAAFARELARNGYTPDSVARIFALRYVVPGPQDVVRFLQKDVLNQEQITEFRMDDEFEDSFDEGLFKAAGVSKDLAKLYYRAAWTLPSDTQAFQMLHRTALQSTDQHAQTYTDDGYSWTTVIGQETVDRLLKFNDILPFWRDKLNAISYTPLTRVDVRRMHKLGVLSGPEVTRAYMDLGYTYENAKRLRAFTESLNGAEHKDESEKFRGPVRTRVLTDFLDGTITREKAESLLAAIGYDDTDTAQWWPAAVELREAKRRAAIRDDVGRLYVDGFWSAGEVSARLIDAGFDAEAVESLVADWTLDRELKVDREAIKADKDLTKAEIMESYRDGLNDREGTLRLLLQAGYDEQESATLVSLQDARTERELAKADIDAIHTQYVRGLIDRQSASAQLDALKLPPRSRNSYLSRWDAERRKAPPVLSNAEIHRLYLAGTLARDVVKARLLGLGLAQADTDALLTLWDQERAAQLRHLTDAELKALAKADKITTAEVVQVLKDRGLSDANAKKLADAILGNP